MFESRKPFAQLLDLIFTAQNVGRAGFNFTAQFFGGGLLCGDFGLQHVELMARKLRVKVLEFLGNLFVAARFAGLALERTDLPLHFADEIGDAQKVLVGVFQFVKRFLFLALVFRDAGGFLENEAAVFGFARKNLRDVALRQNAVTGAAHACAHEQLLDVLEPARCAIDEILAAAVAENPACDRDLVVSHLDPRRAQVFLVHVAQRQRHFGHAHRFASVRAGENHIGHFAAAQCLGRLFAEHPTDGVGDIGFAAPVRADDGSHTGLKVQRSFVRKGFKPQKR